MPMTVDMLPASALSDVFGAFSQWVFAHQRDFYGLLRAQLGLLRTDIRMEPVLVLISIGFLYGVFHALGPGHGKFVIGSYLATRPTKLAHMVAACGLAAIVQAMTASLLVLLFAQLLSWAPRDIMARSLWLEVGSYGLIATMGGLMVWRILRGRGCACDHHHHHHHHHLDDPHDRGVSLFALAAAVGLRPCSGAILILLFTHANNMFWVGILSTMAMAAGVALTVSGVGMSALGLNRLAGHVGANRPYLAAVAQGLSLAGALTIMLMGTALAIGILQETAPSISG